MAAAGSATREVSGIVLAGGRATRFGADKLSTPVHGRALGDYAIEALSRLCDEVIVVVGASGAEPAPTTHVRVPVRVARDAILGGGPVHGLVAGLEAAVHPIVLVAGGDMPALVQGVLRLLVSRIDDGADAAALLEGSTLRPLPCALRRTAARAAATVLPPGAGLRDVLERLHVHGIPEAEWRPHDPDARTLLDVDTPEDLDAVPPDPP